MEKIMDKLEYFAARRIHVICVVALIITLIAAVCGILAQGVQTHRIPAGTYHCPNCGTVMDLYIQEG